MLTGRRYGGALGHVCSVYQDAAAVRRLEPGDHPQQRALAAARGPSSAKNSPASTASEKSSTAAAPANDLLVAMISKIAMPAAQQPDLTRFQTRVRARS